LFGNQPLMQRAKDAASAVLNSLGPGSRAALISFDQNARLLTPGWTSNLNEVRKALDSVRASAGSTNIASALSLLPTLLKNAGAGTREVFLLTDLQQSGWSYVDLHAINDGNLRFLIVDCSGPPVPNAAVDSLELTVTKTLRNAPSRLSATVKNYSDSDLTPRCSLFAQQKKLGEQRLFIPAGGRAEVRFEFNSSERGYLTGYLALGSDGLELDNQRYFCSWIPDTLHIVIVDPDIDSKQRSSQYLSLALSPPGADLSAVKPSVVKNLTPLDLSKTDAVILTDPAQLPSDPWLEAWVRHGGNLLIFSKGDLNPREAVSSLLAGIHPLPQTRLNNDFVRIFQAFPVAADLSNPDIIVRAWFSDGRVSVIQKIIDQGSLLFLAIPSGAAWTDFPLQVSYLPFIHEMLALAVSRNDMELRVGNPIQCLNRAERAEVSLPDGSKIHYDPRTQKNLPIADTPGIYRASIEEKGTVQEIAFAVNSEAGESNPAKISDSQLKKLIPYSQRISGDAVLNSPQSSIGISEWTDVFLILALVLVLAEFVLSGRFAVPASRREGRRVIIPWTR